jgi:hypothetical protein
MIVEWISVDDRLPSDDYVLCFVEYLDIDKTEIIIDHLSEFTPPMVFHGFSTHNDKLTRKITHWMPLPEPPL